MPTFTAIALDRLLEPGASKSADKSVDSTNPIPKPKPAPKAVADSGVERRNPGLERRNSIATTGDRKFNRPQITPALYATAEVTPLPDSPSDDSPSSFPPSPYIVNHKRRGPCLLKSFSEDDVAARRKALEKDGSKGDAENGEQNGADLTRSGSVTFTIPDSVDGELLNGVHDDHVKKERENGANNAPVEAGKMNGFNDGEIGSSKGELGSNGMSNGFGLVSERDVPKIVALNLANESEAEDFFDPQESLSYSSNNDVEDNGGESSVRLASSTPTGEYFDAWEELSTDSGLQLPQHNVEAELHDLETQLREMRLSLLMEIEKRKRAEDALNNTQNQLERIRRQLGRVGLTLPPFTTDVGANGQPADADPAEELCCQVYLARFVSESIGRGIAKAEVETEMESQIEVKNIEIARLCDRLHYYEAMNREMSQRNQEAVELARRNRQLRKRRRRWVWGSIAAAATVGAAALAWYYFPGGNGSSSTSESLASEHEDAAASQ